MRSKCIKPRLLFCYKQNCLIGNRICSFCYTHVNPPADILFGCKVDSNVYSVLNIYDDRTHSMHFGMIISDQYRILKTLLKSPFLHHRYYFEERVPKPQPD